MSLVKINDFLKNEYDYILDARSPGEYEESHIPGSLNFYVLNNEQHSYIGELYKKVSKFKAKTQAVPLMLENIAKHIRTFDAPPGSRILVYCARGGKRSSALYTILSQLDFRVYKLEGGYKAFRKWVVDYLQKFPHNKFAVLRGNSGCGKSDLLNYLNPSLDLEKLANHYGSIFGSKGKQPSQKQFENEIAVFLNSTAPENTVFIEAESPRIGKLIIPKRLHKKMQEGIQIEITADLDERIKRIFKYYGEIDEKNFLNNLEVIKPYIAKTTLQLLKENFKKGNLKKVAEILLLEYYDKKYRKKNADFTIKHTNTEETVKQILSVVNNR